MPLPTILSFAFGFVFFLFWLIAFFVFYHLSRFGVGLLPKRLAALFLIGALALFSTTLLFYISVDFTTLHI